MWYVTLELQLLHSRFRILGNVLEKKMRMEGIYVYCVGSNLQSDVPNLKGQI
jgi:hypothetical protein